jgi:hypothetical protein
LHLFYSAIWSYMDSQVRITEETKDRKNCY